MTIYQKSLKSTVSFIGTGLHTGHPVTMTVEPAAVNTGIVFIRKDLNPEVIIEANHNNLCSTNLATTIGKDGIKISTIEHLMAAFYGIGIDNAYVFLDGPEVPILDGSSFPFIKSFNKVGYTVQNIPARYMQITKQICVKDGDKVLVIEPSNHLSINFKIEFEHPVIKNQIYNGRINSKEFEQKISGARTFGFLHEVEELKKNGLALGGSLENAVVIGETDVLNSEGLRFSDEFVKHKVLDLIGDMALSGFRLKGKIFAFKSGHELHAKLVKKIFKSSNSWKILSDDIPSKILPAWIDTRERVAVAA